MKISYRQLSILVFMSFIALKFLALPSLLYEISGNMSIFVAFVLMLVDGIYVYLLLGLMKKCNEKNIFDFMRKCFGTVITKFFLILLMFKYALVVANLAKGLEFFVVENLYKEFNWFVFVLPLIALCAFMIYKGVRNIARVCELVCWFVLFGMIYVALKAVGGVEPISYLPLFRDGALPLLQSGFTYLNWFGSGIFMVMLFGNVDFSTKKNGTMIRFLFYAVGLTMLVYFVFYGLFKITSSTHNFCISAISEYNTGKSAIDELSWLIVSLWVVAQAVQLALYGFCLAQTIKFTFNINNEVVPILVVVAFMLLWSLLGEKTIRLEEVFYSVPISILNILTSYILPILLWIGYGISKHKQKKKEGVKHEKVKNTV
ncbi:MAG: spore germination protein [Clostridia bacterium]|nr:spore germination protein [Clostridia bacterium]